MFALQTPECAATQILNSPKQNLYSHTDLLELVRWQILQDKAIPQPLLDEVDRKIQDADQPYFWRFKLFLVRMYSQALKGDPVDPRWKPTYEGTKVFIEDESEEDAAAGTQDVAVVKVKQEVVEEEVDAGTGTPAKQDLRLEEAQDMIEAVEHHLVKQHMKKVLAEVYLHTWTAVKNSVPTCGLLDYLSSVANSDDRNAEVKLNTQHPNPKVSICNNGDRCPTTLL